MVYCCGDFEILDALEHILNTEDVPRDEIILCALEQGYRYSG